jgi:ADP-heptose:LPS heptosyltransferase
MDLVRTAALVAGLDAVVTIDTMVAHLAGALGRKVIVMLKPDADWRWGQEACSVWYQTVRLARQREAGDWAGVAAEAAEALTAARGRNFDCASR